MVMVMITYFLTFSQMGRLRKFRFFINRVRIREITMAVIRMSRMMMIVSVRPYCRTLSFPH